MDTPDASTQPDEGGMSTDSPGAPHVTDKPKVPVLAALDAPVGSAQRIKASALGEVTDLDQVFSNFEDPKRGPRRIVAEFVGTFFLVLVAAGGPMMNVAVEGSVERAVATIAPGMMVMAIIMAFGKVSGAHLNPAVSLAFALRGDFPWPRVVPYVVTQILGASAAAYFLTAVLGVSASHGGNYPAAGFSDVQAVLMEFILTFGLVTIILGTASGAQNIGIIGAVGVGSYIALAGMWASPISGASMNPARSFGPALASLDFTSYWVYVVGPLAGALLAVGVGYLLRGKGGGWYGSVAAQGTLGLPPEARPAK
ncbi:MIP/aquaporin family protein [Actinomyces minihominis]|uniref:MIP/aquaporin family protein n=1 Tax=Actinomyces minihominis TaxID=2002838 RepID=UPI001A9392C8|nr:aquaporin [Actinomyces minihominis]